MASEQPQPSSEKFTSYEYGIDVVLFNHSSSCDDAYGAPVVAVWGLVSSTSDQNSKRL